MKRRFCEIVTNFSVRALFATNIWKSLGQYYNSKRHAFNERLLISATIHTKMKETCVSNVTQRSAELAVYITCTWGEITKIAKNAKSAWDPQLILAFLFTSAT